MSVKEVWWAEKYRPQVIDDCILPGTLKQKFEGIISEKVVPNMLLVGSSGIGKTTIARVVCEVLELDYIIINGSEQSGIDVLRNDIRSYATRMSMDGTRKVIIIDESDYMNAQSLQPALRGAMEEFSKNCGFILTANHRDRIIPALQSRCSVIPFQIPSNETEEIAQQLVKRCQFILDSEKVEYDLAAIVEVVLKYYPDFRRVIGELQSLSYGGKIDKESVLSLSSQKIEELIGFLKEKNFSKTRNWLAKNMDSDPTVLYRGLYDSLRKHLEPDSIPHSIILISDYMHKSVSALDQEINTAALMLELMASCEFK